MKMKPGDPQTLIAIANCFRSMAQKVPTPAERIHLYTQARNVMRELHRASMQHAHEAVTWIFADNAQIPLPDEA